MNELGSPLGQAVVVGFAAYIIRPALKFDAHGVCDDGREMIQRHKSFGGWVVFAILEKDGCRYCLFADYCWRRCLGNLGNVMCGFLPRGWKFNYRQRLARGLRAIFAAARLELALDPADAFS